MLNEQQRISDFHFAILEYFWYLLLFGLILFAIIYITEGIYMPLIINGFIISLIGLLSMVFNGKISNSIIYFFMAATIISGAYYLIYSKADLDRITAIANTAASISFGYGLYGLFHRFFSLKK